MMCLLYRDGGTWNEGSSRQPQSHTTLRLLSLLRAFSCSSLPLSSSSDTCPWCLTSRLLTFLNRFTSSPSCMIAFMSEVKVWFHSTSAHETES